jgi:predicted AlkP superfamily pyrophosphatase or phosphodiesterase
VISGDDPPVPRYGESSLADLSASVLTALGVEGFANPLRLEPLAGVCLLMVDGLGWELVRAHAEHAPFLSSLAVDGARPLTSAFPATTASSIASLGTVLPPGRHGLVGYTFAMPGFDRPMNALQWSLFGPGPQVDLKTDLVPEKIQPERTAFQAAAEQGIAVRAIGPPDHARSGLTRAVLRGGDYEGVYSLGDMVLSAAQAVATVGPGRPVLAYVYHPFLDVTAHVRGAASEAVALELSNVDRLAAAIAQRMPPGTALIVTGDHGMVDVPAEDKVEVDDHPALLSGVEMMAGEPRARYLYVRPGAQNDVLAMWRDQLGDRMWIRSREEGIAEGWFGPDVPEHVRPRIGDVVAAARGSIGVIQRRTDGVLADLVGHHGSMTSAEQLVPLLMDRR